LAHYLDSLVERLAAQDSFREPALVTRVQ
jgi:hypothetical protein